MENLRETSQHTKIPKGCLRRKVRLSNCDMSILMTTKQKQYKQNNGT